MSASGNTRSCEWQHSRVRVQTLASTSNSVPSHTRILAHTRMGYPVHVYLYGHPVCVWAAHTRMGWAY